MRRSTKMKQFSQILMASTTMALFAVTSFSATAAASDPIYQIDLNKTQILRLPAAAGSVVIGNPSIADVTIHSPTTIMVVGRGFGETNLIILDRNGHTMVDADIQVTSITPSNGVRLFNAKSRETYSCAPYCQPSPVMGDSMEHISANTPAATLPTGTTSVLDSGSSMPPTLSGAPGGFASSDAVPGSEDH